MPVYVCRWPNGDCSVVLAQNEQDAIIKLDEGRWCTDPAPSVRHDRPPGHRGDSRCMIST